MVTLMSEKINSVVEGGEVVHLGDATFVAVALWPDVQLS